MVFGVTYPMFQLQQNNWSWLDGTLDMMMMYLFTTVQHPHGHWQLRELLGNR